jgi:[NiFe] hydrogenase diaphorase moiety large subunit
MTKKNTQVIFSDIEPLSALKKVLTLSPADVIDEIRLSNVRGRGGAGFPTGVKWNLAAAAKSDRKYVICNADEGEPGTFKDRVLLTEYAELMFEGMIIAAYAVGSDYGYLYLRGEYLSMRANLEKILSDYRKNNILGKDILGKKGFNFDIEIRMGAGAYVCGEETALIESLEGQRGEPRNKPPFPVNTGLFGRPTVVNNVETMVAVPHIILMGADKFSKIGTEKSAGTKLLSVSGDCSKPGVYEVEYGTTINEVLKLADAKDVKAVQVGGASGTCISKKELNRKIAFEDAATGGSIIVFNSKRNMIDVAENFLEFFAEESCGQCTPCRDGIEVLVEGVKKIREGKCTKTDIAKMLSLSETMQIASKCGLGQSASNAFADILKKFPEDYKLS